MEWVQARKVAVSSALLGTPEVLILDEPTNHMDVQVCILQLPRPPEAGLRSTVAVRRVITAGFISEHSVCCAASPNSYRSVIVVTVMNCVRECASIV